MCLFAPVTLTLTPMALMYELDRYSLKMYSQTKNKYSMSSLLSSLCYIL